MEILIKRLKSKQAKDGKLRGENFDTYSDASWSRELGPTFCFRREGEVFGGRENEGK